MYSANKNLKVKRGDHVFTLAIVGKIKPPK